MWGTLGNAVGNAIQKVKKIQQDLETQLDAAVGADKPNSSNMNVEFEGVVVTTLPTNETEDSQVVPTIDVPAIPMSSSSSSSSSKEGLEKVTAQEKVFANDVDNIKKDNDVKTKIERDVCEGQLVAAVEVGREISPIVVNNEEKDKEKVSRPTRVVKKKSSNSIVKSNIIRAEGTANETEQIVQNEKEKQPTTLILPSPAMDVNAVTTTTTTSLSSSPQTIAASAVEPGELFTQAKILPATFSSLSLLSEAQSHMAEQPASPPLQLEKQNEVAIVPTTEEVIIAGEVSVGNNKSNNSVNEGKLREQIAHLESKLRILENDHVNEKLALTSKIEKLSEFVADRERALETAMTKMHEAHQQLDDSQMTVSRLNAELGDKIAQISQLQTIAAEGDMKMKLKKLQDLITEKDEKLAAFEQEGQALAKKQGEMEKLTRQSKKELKDKTSEIQRLKESKDQYVKAIEEMQEVIRKSESDLSNANKSIAALTSMNQLTNDKFLRLEAEMASRQDEVLSQRKVLEQSWAENNELKRQFLEVKAGKDELQRQIGEGNSKFVETETSRRDVEQREAILKATSKQLQDSLQRQMTEFAHREERLREEVNEMRKRWQEAIASRENLATEVASSAAPLLRQISTLQDSIRIKTENWQTIESSLLERAFKAERNLESAERKNASIEEQLSAMQSQLEASTAKLNVFKDKCSDSQAQVESLEKKCAECSEQMHGLQSQLYFEIGQKQSLQTSLHELEIRKNLELQEQKEAFEQNLTKAEVKFTQLQNERRQLNPSALSDIHSNGNSSNDKKKASSSIVLPNNASLIASPNNFAASERIQQQKSRLEDDQRNTLLRISQIEASRDALLEEVSFLSSKNAQLEEQVLTILHLSEEAKLWKKQNEALLILLGEKEEELQAAIADIGEVKAMYKTHVQELLDQIVPTSTTSTTFASKGATATTQ